MRRAAFATVVLGLVAWCGVASADDSVAEGAPGKAIVLKPVQVVGHKPFLTIALARVPHSVALAPLRQRFVERIEKPVQGEPF